MEVQRNPAVLMKAVSKAICGREEHKQPVHSFVQSQKMSFMIIYRNQTKSMRHSKKNLMRRVISSNSKGGCMWRRPGLINDRAIEIAEEKATHRMPTAYHSQRPTTPNGRGQGLGREPQKGGHDAQHLRQQALRPIEKLCREQIRGESERRVPVRYHPPPKPNE